MTSLIASLQTLSGNMSGHWGIVQSEGAQPLDNDLACISDLQGDRHVGFLHLRCGQSTKLTQVDTGEAWDLNKLDDRLDRLIAEARTDGRRLARCLVTRFGDLSLDDECLVLRLSRAVRDRTPDFKLQTIVSGTWNFFRVQEHWRRHYAGTLSPALDRKHVLFHERQDFQSILSRLLRAKLVSEPLDRFQEVCVDVLAEASGGDAFLLDYIISSLTSQHQRLEALESVFAQVPDSGEVVDEFRRRASRLGPGAWNALLSILLRQISCRLVGDPDAEDLRLAGFTTVHCIGNNQCMAPASPLAERLLRQNWSLIAAGKPPVDPGHDLARPILALNTAAYRTVAEIENTLRNLVVLSLNQTGDWHQQVAGVKTLPYDGGEISHELLGLARKIQEVCLPPTEIPAPQPPKLPEAAPESNPAPEAAPVAKKPKQITLLEAAKNWRERNRTNTVLQLSHESLIYFFTSEGLASLLANEKQDIYARAVRPFFPSKHELATFLEHYVAIRAAVAHNQPISLSTLKRLQTMRDDLDRRIYQAQG